MKTDKKVNTNDESIDSAEQKLNIVFPQIIREKLKDRNGFQLGEFRFFGVLDKEDLQHTFDDIVKENTNPQAGWSQYLPKEYVAIADDGGQGCLVLNTNKDGKAYYWNHQDQKLNVYAENNDDFVNKLKEEELESEKALND